MTTTTERTTAIIVHLCGFEPGEVKPDSTLQGDLRLDSLDIVELVMNLEDDFAIEIPDDEIEPLKTVADVLAYVERRVALVA